MSPLFVPCDIKPVATHLEFLAYGGSRWWLDDHGRLCMSKRGRRGVKEGWLGLSMRFPLYALAPPRGGEEERGEAREEKRGGGRGKRGERETGRKEDERKERKERKEREEKKAREN